MDTNKMYEKIGENYDKIFLRFASRKEINGKASINSKASKVCSVSYLDLKIIFYMQFKVTADESIIMYITDSNIEKWGISLRELLLLAIENCKINKRAVVRSMSDVMKELGAVEISGDDKTFILTNEKGKYGASGIIYPGVKEMIYDLIGGDYYILPSSIHECILLKYREHMDIKGLKEVVSTVNRTEVKPEEVLSDSVYVCKKSENGCKIDIF